MKKTLVVVALAGALALLWASGLFAQWESDVRLTYDENISYVTNNSNGRCDAASGNFVHVVWSDDRDDIPSHSFDEIYYKRSFDGGQTWEPDVRLTNSAAYSNQPAVAVWLSNVYVVWQDSRAAGGFSGEIYFKRSTDGGATWGDDVRLTTTGGNSFRPSVAVSGPNIHVVWANRQTGDYEIYYKRSLDGGLTWGTNTPITTASGPSDVPAVAVFGSNVHIVWQDNQNLDYWTEILYIRSTNNGGTWRDQDRREIYHYPFG